MGKDIPHQPPPRPSSTPPDQQQTSTRGDLKNPKASNRPYTELPSWFSAQRTAHHAPQRRSGQVHQRACYATLCSAPRTASRGAVGVVYQDAGRRIGGCCCPGTRILSVYHTRGFPNRVFPSFDRPRVMVIIFAHMDRCYPASATMDRQS